MRNKELVDVITSREEYMKMYRNDAMFHNSIEYLAATEPNISNCVHIICDLSNNIKELQYEIKKLTRQK